MLARLWWKEWRLFGPAWLILAVAAVLLQWFLLATGGDEMKTGGLTWAALAWTVLYAFASGSAAFAAERESKTLGFLDALPVPRSTLWLGKVSFAIASTVALGVVLALLAAMGTVKRIPAMSYATIGPLFVSLIIESVAWGLLWSSIFRNPMAAAASAVVCVGAINLPTLDGTLEFSLARWIGAAAALGVSGLIMAWRPRPIVRVQRVRVPRPPAVPQASPTASVGRSLSWQAWREGRATWLLMMFVGLFIPISDSITRSLTEGVVETFLATVACLMGGVAVFGTENASDTRRFLNHQGIAPGQAWGRRMVVWGLGVATFVGVLVMVEVQPDYRLVQHGGLDLIRSPTTAGAIVLNAFGVGVLCGMAFRRRITAGLVAIVAMVALVPLQVGLAEFGMIPTWSLYLSPMILLAVSRVWAGDWLADREGWRPWAKLGVSLAVPFGMLFATYVGYRALGEPDAPAVFVASANIPRGWDERVEKVYRRAIDVVEVSNDPIEITAAQGAIERGWDPKNAGLASYLERNRSASGLARQAAAMPRAWFGPTDTITIETTFEIMGKLRTIGRLLALEARERQATGDLAGAWDDILAQFQIARHSTEGTPTYIQILTGAQIHHQAVGLAEEWACDPKQTLELIRKAKQDLRLIPEIPTAAEAVKVESGIIDRTLDRSPEDIYRIFAGYGSGGESILSRIAFNTLAAPSWERERARRITRRIFAAEVAQYAVDPYRRPKVSAQAFDAPEVRSCPLVRFLYPASEAVAARLDLEHAGRRRLDQVLGLRSWQFSHDGKYPETLQALVPTEMASLPVDPFSGRAFGYTLSHGQYVRPPMVEENSSMGDLIRSTQPGQRLLYSIGPDGVDSHAESVFTATLRTGDLIIALP